MGTEHSTRKGNALFRKESNGSDNCSFQANADQADNDGDDACAETR